MRAGQPWTCAPEPLELGAVCTSEASLKGLTQLFQLGSANTPEGRCLQQVCLATLPMARKVHPVLGQLEICHRVVPPLQELPP